MLYSHKLVWYCSLRSILMYFCHFRAEPLSSQLAPQAVLPTRLTVFFVVPRGALPALVTKGQPKVAFGNAASTASRWNTHLHALTHLLILIEVLTILLPTFPRYQTYP